MTTICPASRLHARKGYTLIEFVALLIIIAIGIGMLIPAIQAAREASRRSRCTNNLKEIGRGIHEFYQSQKGLPPICIFGLRPTIFSLLLPHIQQQELYEKMVADGHFRKAEMRLDPNVVPCDPHWFNSLNPEEKNAFSSVTTFLCPNRHQAPAMTPEGMLERCAGPLADYAGLIVTIDGQYQGWHLFSEVRNDERYMQNFEASPLRRPQLEFHPEQEDPGMASHHCRSITNWFFTDSMDRWQDGASNQFIFAEKHIPEWALGGDTTEKSLWDGGWHGVYYANAVGNTARHVPLRGDLGSINRKLPAPTQDIVTLSELQHSIGSMHPGILANVLVGDGAVRPLWLNMKPELIWRLTHVKGIAIELP